MGSYEEKSGFADVAMHKAPRQAWWQQLLLCLSKWGPHQSQQLQVQNVSCFNGKTQPVSLFLGSWHCHFRLLMIWPSMSHLTQLTLMEPIGGVPDAVQQALSCKKEAVTMCFWWDHYTKQNALSTNCAKYDHTGYTASTPTTPWWPTSPG